MDIKGSFLECVHVCLCVHVCVGVWVGGCVIRIVSFLIFLSSLASYL